MTKKLKNLLCLFALIASFSNLANGQDFITVWDLSNPGSSSTSITFDVGTTGPVNYTWETVPAQFTGSGNFTGATATISGLPLNKRIRLKINPTNFNQIMVNNNSDKARLKDIEQWGAVSWTSMQYAFFGCNTLNISATDVPNLSSMTNMSFMFSNCTALNGPANIGTWNTDKIVYMNNMFDGASNFNQPIGNWITDSVVFMQNMFYGATSFNQPIGNWNTIKVNNMNSMFSGASDFNQPIGNWNLTAAIDNANMLDNCGMDCINYSTTLIGWANNITNMPNGLTLGALGMKYGTNAVSSRNNLINTKSWTINGDVANGFKCCVNTTSSFSATNCYSYVFDNKTLTTSGTYFDTLFNANATGCDSIIELNLTINNTTTSSFNDTTCSAYSWNGQIYRTSGVYFDTLINSNGCDSIIALNLFSKTTLHTINQTACSSFSFNNQILTQSGTYYDTLINSVLCDSLITLNLTIINPTFNTINQISCTSFTFNNQVLTSSGTYYDTLTNSVGCDSIITLKLKIGVCVTDFVTVWDMTKPGSSPNSITFGVGTTGPVNYIWEDLNTGATGSGSFSGSTATITGLPTLSTIELRIKSNNFNRFRMNNTSNKSRLVGVTQWGDASWSSMEAAFFGCNNLNISATDVPDLSLVSNMSSMFRNCSNLTGPANINTWNTSNVTSMYSMFYNALDFNQPIDNWNTSNVVSMFNMFFGASNFNQPIGNWNTSGVTDMYRMFADAISFNEPIGNWNTTNVINMNSMFYGASNFNQPIGNWNLTSLISNTNMLDNCGMDCNNYSTTLIGWANNINTPNGLSLGASGINYGTNAASSRNYLLNTKGWTITGDIVNAFACCVPTASNQSQTACNSYTFNNQTLTQSGIYFDTLTNSTGCDSIITLNLTIKNKTSTTINQSACNSYTFNNQTITQSGTYFNTLTNSVGCDSIVTLNLTINNSNTATTQSGTQLSASATGATYQWLTCSPFTLIAGATNQTYTATTNGDYAVIVTENGCTDTSNCMTVNSVGINDINTNNLVTISPNPTHSIFKIECPMNGAKVILYNSFGQKLLISKIEKQSSLIDISQYPSGIYFAEVKDEKATYRVKVVKD
jgi:surface protein